MINLAFEKWTSTSLLFKYFIIEMSCIQNPSVFNSKFVGFRMCLSPRESGAFISSVAKHVVIHESGVAKCAEEILKRLKTGEISLEALYKKTELHPQQADDKVLFNSLGVQVYCSK